jgi:hypothetical protein
MSSLYPENNLSNQGVDYKVLIEKLEKGIDGFLQKLSYDEWLKLFPGDSNPQFISGFTIRTYDKIIREIDVASPDYVAFQVRNVNTDMLIEEIEKRWGNLSPDRVFGADGLHFEVKSDIKGVTFNVKVVKDGPQGLRINFVNLKSIQDALSKPFPDLDPSSQEDQLELELNKVNANNEPSAKAIDILSEKARYLSEPSGAFANVLGDIFYIQISKFLEQGDKKSAGQLVDILMGLKNAEMYVEQSGNRELFIKDMLIFAELAKRADVRSWIKKMFDR